MATAKTAGVSDGEVPLPDIHDAPRALTISVAAPAYNEAENIAAVVGEWRAYLDQHPAIDRWEIVVCDDGSTDATGAILGRLQAGCPELIVVDFPRNRGAAAAITAAIGHTSLDWVVLLDSDGQFPIANLDRFIERLLAGDGVAFSGARTAKVDRLPYRWGSAASGVVSNLLLGTRYRDFNSIFKVVAGPLMRALSLESSGMNCSTEITARVAELGYPWVEIPIEHRARHGGRRGWRFWRGARDRALYVGYLGYRAWLLRRGTLRAHAAPELVPGLAPAPTPRHRSRPVSAHPSAPEPTRELVELSREPR